MCGRETFLYRSDFLASGGAAILLSNDPCFPSLARRFHQLHDTAVLRMLPPAIATMITDFPARLSTQLLAVGTRRQAAHRFPIAFVPQCALKRRSSALGSLRWVPLGSSLTAVGLSSWFKEHGFGHCHDRTHFDTAFECAWELFDFRIRPEGTARGFHQTLRPRFDLRGRPGPTGRLEIGAQHNPPSGVPSGLIMLIGVTGLACLRPVSTSFETNSRSPRSSRAPFFSPLRYVFPIVCGKL